MSEPINLQGVKAFKDTVLESETPVLVDFWASWCGPCRMMAPVLEKVAEKFEGKIKVVKVNTEQAENQPLAFEYQIQSIPNMKLFKGGKVIKDFIGFRPEQVFLDELKEFFDN